MGAQTEEISLDGDISEHPPARFSARNKVVQRLALGVKLATKGLHLADERKRLELPVQPEEPQIVLV